MNPRSVLITGASSGIGLALARMFARRGDRVIATARRRESLRRLVRNLRTEGVRCLTCVCDVRSDRSINAALRWSKARVGPLDVIINNAGITSFKTTDRLKLWEFDEIIRTNLRGPVAMAMAVLPMMRSRRKGLLINILSYAAKTTYKGSSAYSASKAGLEAFMNVLREENREFNIRIMNVYPGAVLTPMWQSQHRKKFASRMMSAEDAAGLIYAASAAPSSMMVEELIVRPQHGDLII